MIILRTKKQIVGNFYIVIIIETIMNVLGEKINLVSFVIVAQEREREREIWRGAKKVFRS